MEENNQYPHQFEDDRIDLYEIWITIYEKKLLIVAITLIASILSVYHALNQPSIYKAQTLILPPKKKDLLNIEMFRPKSANSNPAPILGFQPGGTEIKNLFFQDEKHIFETFQKNLRSRIFQREFVENNNLIEVFSPHRTKETRDIEILEDFYNMINIKRAYEDQEIISVSIESEDPVFATNLLNNFVSSLDRMTVKRQCDAARFKISNWIDKIEKSIASKRAMAKKRREDKIIRFEEAKIVAESLGFVRRVDATSIIQSNWEINSDIASATTPLYYIGTKALSAEIQILKSRKSDDPFILGLRDSQEELAFLRSIEIVPDNYNSVTVDQEAYIPKYPIKPNRRKIVILGSTFGLFFGIFFVFIFSFIQKQRLTHLSKLDHT